MTQTRRVYRKKYGVYRSESPLMQAFIFCGNEMSLWGWAVYWSGGSKSGVEHNFKRAKNRANEWADAAEGKRAETGDERRQD